MTDPITIGALIICGWLLYRAGRVRGQTEGFTIGLQQAYAPLLHHIATRAELSDQDLARLLDNMDGDDQ